MLSSASLSPTLRRDLKQRWLSGERVLVESYCSRHPTLSSNLEMLLELIEAEYTIREELGDSPTLEEYLQRFPQHSDTLQKRLSGKSARPSANTEDDHPSAQPTRKLACPFCGTALPSVQADGVRCAKCHRNVHVLTETISLRFKQGRMLGAFELLRPVGRGQFGEIWLARDTELERDVAIKMPRTLEPGDETTEMFLREARSAARLQHPNIVPVFEADYFDNTPYIVSAYIRGTNLKDLINRHTITPQRAAELCRPIADALAHAHAACIVHRDIKPGNILIDLAGTPFVTDFGLAKHTATEEATVTPDGHLIGTPAYMSPEQARGTSPVDGTTDIYSLGVTLYEMLTRRRPFEGKLESVLYQIMSEEPPRPRKLDKNIPEDLEIICLKAMSKNPADRFASARELADDLDRYLKGEQIQARRLGVMKRSLRWSRRNAMKIGAGSLIAGLGGLAGANFFGGGVPTAAGPRPVQMMIKNGAGSLAFIPLESDTRQPRPDLITYADAKPLATLELLPGDYLVVAQGADGRFHEVQRQVPDYDAGVPFGYPHRRYRMLDDVVELPAVTLFDAAPPPNMAHFEGAHQFEMGRKEGRALIRHRRTVRAFLLDNTEVTVGDFRRNKGNLPLRLKRMDPPPPDDQPVTWLSYDEAMYFAESIGKRLPEEAEFEFAATNSGTTRYPWGNELPEEARWEIGPIGVCKFDTSISHPELRGLCSNIAEWVTTSFHLPPEKIAKFELDPKWQVARGGSERVIAGKSADDEWRELPHLRITLKGEATFSPGLGMRCGRSVRPRLRKEDFGMVLEKATN